MTADTPPKHLPSPWKCLIIYDKMTENLTAAGRTVNELIAHPDATDEQILTTARQYAAMHASVRATRKKLRKHFPQSLLSWNLR